MIFSNAAIQWCDAHPAIFQRLKNSLKPAGQLAVQMPMNHDYPTHVLAHAMMNEPRWLSLMKPDVGDAFFDMLSVEEYASLLFRLGFVDQKVFLRVYGHVLESREGVIDWVKGTLLTRFQSRMSGEDYETFLKEYRERLFEKLPDDAPFFYPFKRVLIWAKNEG